MHMTSTGRPITFDAKLVGMPLEVDDPPAPTSWFITHPLGRPAAGTFTEVEVAPGVDGKPWPEAVAERVVRDVAGQLYGAAYAFLYRPDQYEHSIAAYRMRRRERVIVYGIEVLG